jgi:hypothetical protein
MRTWSLSLAVIVVLAGVACSSGPPAPDQSGYAGGLAAARANKDRQFIDLPLCGTPPACSPVPMEQRAALLPLPYFPIDQVYAVPALLRLADERPVFEMPTSTGALRRMQLVGTLQFTLQGSPHTLGAFVPEGSQQIEALFVPFADETTGTETYASGRYLDITPTATGYYTIDFNLAYNPYCAYNETYECPFPPPSNRMDVAIRAGEKAPGA